MKKQTHKRCILAWTLAASMVICSAPADTAAAAGKSAGIRTKGYTISKKAGTYTGKVTLKIKAKKGYRVYYTKNGVFQQKKKITANKTRKLTLKKTTSLSVYAVKNGKKVTARQLRKMNVRKQRGCATYVYKIVSASAHSSTPASTAPVKTSGAASSTPTASSSASTSGTTASNTPAASGSTSTNQPGITSQAPTSSSAPASNAPNISASPAASSAPQESTSATPMASTAVESSAPTQTPTAENIAVSALPDLPAPSAQTLPTDYDEETVQTLTLTGDGMTTANLKSESGAVLKTDDTTGISTLTISEAGTYQITGGSEDAPLTNTVISIKKNTGEVTLIWDKLYIDNSALGSAADQDVPVFQIKSGDDTANHVTVYLKGTSSLTGNGAVYTETTDDGVTTALPGGVIEAKGTDTVLTFAQYDSEEDGTLYITDAMDPDTTDYGTEDPSDGISCKGTLILQSGTYQITANGDCLKGTGADGTGGVSILDSTIALHSSLGNGIKSKNGNIGIYGGTTTVSYSKEDGVNAKNYAAAIYGGTLTIKNCHGDGIQGETVAISGDDTVIDITTIYENAGKNYYDTSLGNGNYNTLTSTNSTKTETVSVDTGSHKGIKAGTKSCTYSYTTVSDGSTDADGNALTAGTTYTQEASGGLIIAGGTITVDTTQTGIKYNGGNGGGDRNNTSTTAANDGQYIIGAPDDTIHSNNTCVISGGSLTLASADDALTCADSLQIAGLASIDITTCYEGIEAGTITIGTEGSASGPSVTIYSNDDGINAASKSETTYIYADESEETYTKTTVSSSDNVLYIYSGYVNVMIADDESHSITLPVSGESDVTITYTAEGDGIDCNGSFYAYGGTILVYGANSNDNSPVDTDGTYAIGSGVTLLAIGSSGMVENPSSVSQAYVSTSQSGSGMRFAGPGGNSSTSFSAGSAVGILDSDGNVLLSICPNKSYSYLFYTSPSLVSGSSYTLYTGGTATDALTTYTYDFRYASYDTTNASAQSTLTASSSVSTRW